MANVARNHHFIPEFFLANFTPSGTKDDFLWVTDMREHRGFASKPCNTGFQKDLYRVHLDEAPSDVIEKILGWFEGHAAPTVRHVLEHHSLPPRPERDHLMELIGMMAIRVPAARARAEAVLDKAMKAMFRPYLGDRDALRAIFEKMCADGAELPEGVDYDKIDFDELVRFCRDEDLYTMGVDNEWLLGQMLMASVPVQRMLFDRNWAVLVDDDDEGEFVCSDAPVCLTWTAGNGQDRVPRLDEGQTDLTVPLSKHVALRGRYEADQDELLRCDRQDIAHINIRTISSGDRFLYSSGKDFPWERDDGSVGGWEEFIQDLGLLAQLRVRERDDDP